MEVQENNDIKKTKDFYITLDLSKFVSATTRKFKTASGEEIDCVVIPIERNGIYASKETGSLYFKCIAQYNKHLDYGSTHILIRKLSKEDWHHYMKKYRVVPVIGELKPINIRKSDGAYVFANGYAPWEDVRNIEKIEKKKLQNELLNEEKKIRRIIKPKEKPKPKTSKKKDKNKDLDDLWD